MKAFSSVTAPHRTVRITRDSLLKDSSFSYADIGCVSASLCSTFMEVFDIYETESENYPYSFICRFLKGSIPTWRLVEVPAFITGEAWGEKLDALMTLRRFLRAVRNDCSERSHKWSSRKVESCVIANLKTGKTMVVVRLD